MQQRRIALFIALVALLPIVSQIPASYSEECDGDTCINIDADDINHLLITVRKGKPATSATNEPSARPRPTTSPKRELWIPWLPEATPRASARARPARTSATKVSKPRKSPRPRVTKVAAISLAEQVRQLLPSGVILTQPAAAFLVREPINFMTTVPQTFHTVIVVLEVPIQITMRASYNWEFGDGAELTSAIPGAPYPAPGIRHTYQSVGERTLKLRVSWSGSWRAGAISAPISGSIRQEFERKIQIRAADTHLTR